MALTATSALVHFDLNSVAQCIVVTLLCCRGSAPQPHACGCPVSCGAYVLINERNGRELSGREECDVTQRPGGGCASAIVRQFTILGSFGKITFFGMWALRHCSSARDPRLCDYAPANARISAPVRLAKTQISDGGPAPVGWRWSWCGVRAKHSGSPRSIASRWRVFSRKLLSPTPNSCDWRRGDKI